MATTQCSVEPFIPVLTVWVLLRRSRRTVSLAVTYAAPLGARDVATWVMFWMILTEFISPVMGCLNRHPEPKRNAPSELISPLLWRKSVRHYCATDLDNALTLSLDFWQGKRYIICRTFCKRKFLSVDFSLRETRSAGRC